jgi:hypothetical protein
MPDWILQVIGIVGAGVGTYSAIRADLARLHEVAHQARDAAALAHRRIDNMTERRGAK